MILYTTKIRACNTQGYKIKLDNTQKSDQFHDTHTHAAFSSQKFIKGLSKSLNSSLLLHDQLEHLRLLKLSIQLCSHGVQLGLRDLLDLHPPPPPLLGYGHSGDVCVRLWES